MVSVRSGELTYEGFRLVYTEHGRGPRPFVLLSGLMLPRSMHRRLAIDLAERGNRVITFDLLGHGESDRPRDMWRYSMPQLGEQVVALMDHLELEEAIVGGTSLGANVTLETVVRVPDRVRAMVIEMPVLDNALTGCAIAFTPLLMALTFGAPLTRLLARGASLVPRVLPHYGNVGLDVVSQDPGPSAALLQGLFFGRIAPPRSERSRIETPALVLGHPRDPVHPFSDADMLARELRHGHLVDANAIWELRVTPERLTREIARFLDDRWRPPAQRETRRRATA